MTVHLLVVNYQKKGSIILRNKIKYICIILFWIIAWQIIAIIINNNIFFAGPVAVFIRLLDFVLSKKFWISVISSIGRVMLGFFIAFLAAYIFAFLAYEKSWIKDILYPLVTTLRSVPVAAVVVIISIIAGSKWLSLYVTFMVLFPIIYMNILEELENVDTRMLEMARMYTIGWFDKYKYIYMPDIKPGLLSAIKTGVGMGFKSGVAAEVISLADNSIGLGIYSSKIYLDTPGVLAWTIVVILISYILEKLLVKAAGLAINKRRTTVGLDDVRTNSTSNIDRIQDQGKDNDAIILSTPSLIKLSGLTKKYKEHIVLENTDCQFEAGKIYCVSADSGKGKTTIARIVAGLEKGDECLEYVNDNKISFMFQDYRLCEEETVFTNLRMVNKNITNSKINDLLRQAGLGKILNQKVSELSGGMKKRLAVLRALIYVSDVLILDEPFTGLDYENAIKMIGLINDYKCGRTVIFTSHDKRYCEELKAELVEID